MYEFNGGDGLMETRVIAPMNSMVVMEVSYTDAWLIVQVRTQAFGR
jgi:hypothetical protein